MKILFFISVLIGFTKSFSMDKTICTKKPVNSYNEYLEAFKEGPCSPVVFIPPLMGTGLKVTADCDTLKANKDTNDQSAFVLKHCPFMCSFGKKYYENMIWAYDTQQWKYMYLNDFNFIWKRRECAFYLITVQYQIQTKYDEQGKETESSFREVPIPGVEIRVIGDTKQTKATSECGRKAMTTTFGYPSNEISLMTFWEEMGYVHGVTLQSVPYDFRRSGNRNGITDKMKFALKQVTGYTQKRAFLVAHSYGNNNTMYAFKGLTQQEKDSMVREYVAIGAPFLGTVDAIFFILGANDWLYSPSIEQNFGLKWLSKYFDGIDPYYAQKTFPSIDALYEFFPQPKYFKEQYELFLKNLPYLRNAGFRLEFLEDIKRDAERMDIGDLVSKTYAQPLEFNDYSIHTLDRMIEDLAFTDFAKKYYKQYDYEEMAIHKNPGVATRVVLLTEVLTISNLILKEDPESAFKDNRFPEYLQLYQKGDQTINLFSLAIPPLNWLVEYEQHQSHQTNSGNSNEVTPKKISIVEFGPRESQIYSDNYLYIKCIDKPNQIPYDNQGIWDSFTHVTAYFGYKMFRGVKGVFDKIKRVFRPTKHNEKDYSVILTPEMQKDYDEQSGQLKDMFGKETCTHAKIVSNPQFELYFYNLLLQPEKERIEGNEMGPINEETWQKLVDTCLTVTCHQDFDGCWNQFMNILEDQNK